MGRNGANELGTEERDFPASDGSSCASEAALAPW